MTSCYYQLQLQWKGVKCAHLSNWPDAMFSNVIKLVRSAPLPKTWPYDQKLLKPEEF